jgi:hypothetical protein
MAEIGQPFRRIVVIPAVPEQEPVPAPHEPVKVPEKEPT